MRRCSVCNGPLLAVTKPNVECSECGTAQCFRCAPHLPSACQQCARPLRALLQDQVQAGEQQVDNRCSTCRVEDGHLSSCPRMANTLQERRAKASRDLVEEARMREKRFAEQHQRLKEERDPLQPRDPSRPLPSFGIHVWQLILSHVQRDFCALSLVCRRMRSILEALPVVTSLLVTRGHTSSGGAIGVLKAMNPLQHTMNDLRFRGLTRLAIGSLVRMTMAACETLQCLPLHVLDLRGDTVIRLDLENFARNDDFRRVRDPGRSDNNALLYRGFTHPSLHTLHVGALSRSEADALLHSPVFLTQLRVLTCLIAEELRFHAGRAFPSKLTTFNVTFGRCSYWYDLTRFTDLTHFGAPIAANFPDAGKFPAVKSASLPIAALAGTALSKQLSLCERLTVLGWTIGAASLVPHVTSLCIVLDSAAPQQLLLEGLSASVRRLEIRCAERLASASKPVSLAVPRTVETLRCELPLCCVEADGDAALRRLAVPGDCARYFRDSPYEVVITHRNDDTLFDV